MATFNQSWLSDYAKNHREYENIMRDKVREQIKKNMPPPLDATLGYSGGGHSGMMGVSGSMGPMGMQGVQGLTGSQGISGKTVFKQDVYVDNMSLRQFVHQVPASSIEDAFLELANKYGLYTIDGTANIMRDIKNAENWRDKNGDDEEDWSTDELDDAIGFEEEQEKCKTFTLDEVIKIINSMSVSLGTNDFWKEELIDKKILIEKFKNA